MQVIVFAATIFLSVLLDQITKYIAVAQLKPIGSAPFIDGIVKFTYVENTGAAFGMMKGFRWGFIIISSLAIIGIAFYAIRYRKSVPPLLNLSLAMIAGGGIGNQIDRIINGFVVDFFDLQFMNFAVFNVADCFVTVGTVLTLIDLIFVDRHLLADEGNQKKSSDRKANDEKSESHNEITEDKAE